MANNLKLNETFEGVGKAIKTVGNIAAPSRRARKSVNLGNYNNIRNMSPAAPAQRPPSLPSNTSGLLNKGKVTTPYGSSTRYEQNHQALDIARGMNAPVYSESGGKVIGVDRGKKQGDKGYGNSVIVQDKNGNKFRYSHLNEAWVKVGDVVNRGTVLGGEGNTGSTYSTTGGSGVHLDLRIKDAYNRYVNPITYIQQQYAT